ncbi:MAG: prepilin-type N-terminal cleavage/methylation domain-containing protein [Candidatus Acidiferrales bacterium]
MSASNRRPGEQAGFTLVETVIALVVLSVGVLSLAAMLATGLVYMNGSQKSFIAHQKAAEAVESIYTARDIQQASWVNINNTGTGGIFLAGPQPLCDPGPDGIVGTADDNCNIPDYILTPGPDGILGTADDVKVPLSGFTRQITIADVPGRAGLRSITVVVTFTTGAFTRTYTLQTNISEYS